jgi:hypothetical protein
METDDHKMFLKNFVVGEWHGVDDVLDYVPEPL